MRSPPTVLWCVIGLSLPLQVALLDEPQWRSTGYAPDVSGAARFCLRFGTLIYGKEATLMENDQRRALMERIRPALERARRVPTGEKPTGICTRCGLPSSFEVATVGSTGKKLGTATTVENGDERVLLCRCRNCGRHMVVFERYVRSPRVHPHWTVFGAFPAAVPVGISDVPENIAELCREAATCLSVGCYRATGFLSRCIIESAADHQGATGRSLHEKITSFGRETPSRTDRCVGGDQRCWK